MAGAADRVDAERRLFLIQAIAAATADKDEFKKKQKDLIKVLNE